ncbi:hypothetical protein ACQEVB_00445 [Pseudonocardia sp. CA-107938]|uniref:hypothetical protein n=1 Tax=Pseudonocardia sp. CA-107938 TaxID=3240021 RepID=UPI003D8F080A
MIGTSHDEPAAATALLDREADTGTAVVVQDGPAHRSPAAERSRGRRQLAFSAVSALCVAALVGVLVHVAEGGKSPVGIDNTGFGIFPDAPPPAELPRTLLDPPSAGQQAAAPGVNGLGDALGQGVATVFAGANSPWVQRATGAIDPNSAAMVAGLAGEKFQMSTGMWTVPVYYADASTPRHDVPITAGWTEFSSLPNVPVPPNAKPDPSEDAHLTIIDRSKGCVYDFWGASGSGGNLSAKLGNAMPTTANGIDPGGLGARASGFSGAAGLITYEDMKRGSIDHALVFAYPKTRSGGPVSPATKSDGSSGGDDAIPEGARLRLDPSINLASLGLNRYEMMIARALQQYGMILGDTSGGFTIYAQHPQSVPGGSYGGMLPDNTWVDLSKIPTDRLQVMKMGPQKDNASGTVGNRCNGH